VAHPLQKTAKGRPPLEKAKVKIISAGEERPPARPILEGRTRTARIGRPTRLGRKCYNVGLTDKDCQQAAVMSGKRVEEIERVIGTLTREELEELREWLDEYAGPRPLDRRIEADLAAGRLDGAAQNALEDEKHGRVRPL
jgi:hypothetical protein